MDENPSNESQNPASLIPTNTSEEMQNPSESFGNDSEENSYSSEDVRKVSENTLNYFRRQTKSSEKTEYHTLTVRETAKIFEDSEVPITERSIINWCHQNKRGECRLDCFYDEYERKYYITPQSIDRVIKEEKENNRKNSAYLHDLSEAKQMFSENFGNASEDVAPSSETLRNTSESFINASEADNSHSRVNNERFEPEFRKVPPHNYDDIEKDRKLEDLEYRLREAEINSRVKDHLINRLQDEVKKVDVERKIVIDKIIETQRHAGILEGKLMQLGEPIPTPKQLPATVNTDSEKTQELPNEYNY